MELMPPAGERSNFSAAVAIAKNCVVSTPRILATGYTSDIGYREKNSGLEAIDKFIAKYGFT